MSGGVQFEAVSGGVQFLMISSDVFGLGNTLAILRKPKVLFDCGERRDVPPPLYGLAAIEL